MTPFRLDDDESERGLPWRLMRNGPVTKYWRQEYFEEDIKELEQRRFRVVPFNCREWPDEATMHEALRVALGLPENTGRNFDALADSLSEIDVPEDGGLVVALDNFEESERNNRLFQVFADASRWWLLFGRTLAVIIRTDDPAYRGRDTLGATPPQWNGREWLDSNRG
jgi:RNAse (barnase) inhibitor barstar